MENETTSVTAKRPPQSFTKKRITVAFTVASGALGPSATDDTVTLTDMRCRANIINGGQNYGNQLSLRIEGMPLWLMNRLSVVVGLNDNTNNNNSLYTASVVRVDAGDDNSGMSTIFVGQIAEAFADFNGAPEVAFQVTAYATLAYQVDKIEPTSAQGSVSAFQIISTIAGKAGLTAVDHGTSKIFLTNVYQSGDTLTQISGIVNAFGGVYSIDTVSKQVHIYPNNTQISDTGTALKISKYTGLVGYPSYNQYGINFTAFFNPHILYFTPFHLQSDYLPAGWTNNQMGQDVGPAMPVDGYWRGYLIQHDISSETPDGPWFTYVSAIRADRSEQEKTI